MTPGFFGLPPEVNSVLLSTGPGSGPLLASAAAWSSLAGQYVLASDDLIRALAESHAVWEGPSAEAFRAAHVPMLAWLADQAASATAVAAQHTGFAAAYEAALAAMPTIAEITANRAELMVLLGTNFLGVNAIPIAVNEADYGRMWAQAASVMEGYQAAAEAILADAPPAPPAPKTLHEGPVRARAAQNLVRLPGKSGDMNELDLLRPISDLLRSFGLDNLAADLTKLVERAAETGLSLLASAPLLAVFAYLVVAQGYWLVWAAIFTAPILLPLLLVAVQQALDPHLDMEEPAPEADRPSLDDARPGHHDIARGDRLPPQPAIVSAPSAPTASSAPASSAPTASSATPPSSPPATTTAPPSFGFYALGGGGGGGERFGPTSTAGASSPAASAAAVGQSSKDSASGKHSEASRARARTRRKVKLEEDQRMHADADMTLAEQPETAPTASAMGSGHLGASQPAAVGASGFQKLPEGVFNTGPAMPMLPSTWNQPSE